MKFSIFLPELIATVILICSLLGMMVILIWKIPVLVKLPRSSSKKGEPLALKIKNGVKTLPGLKGFDGDLYLQKILSKIRILTLKAENKTGLWLERLRQKNNQKNNPNNDNYWKELKKAKNGK